MGSCDPRIQGGKQEILITDRFLHKRSQLPSYDVKYDHTHIFCFFFRCCKKFNGLLDISRLPKDVSKSRCTRLKDVETDRPAAVLIFLPHSELRGDSNTSEDSVIRPGTC